MSQPVSRAADRFWNLVGFEEPFPRALETSMVLACQVTVVRQPSLTPAAIALWFAQSRVPFPLRAKERPLKGCLVAQKGYGFIFIDEDLSADELRLTLGHELAHYLLHYYWPRERAIEHFGHAIRPVLDGQRPPTPIEKLSGALQGIDLEPCCHLLDRGSTGGFLTQKNHDHEIEADLLAFELLAPASAVRKVKPPDRESALIDDFGFPPWAARAWAAHINTRGSRGGFISGLRAAARRK